MTKRDGGDMTTAYYIDVYLNFNTYVNPTTFELRFYEYYRSLLDYHIIVQQQVTNTNIDISRKPLLIANRQVSRNNILMKPVVT